MILSKVVNHNNNHDGVLFGKGIPSLFLRKTQAGLGEEKGVGFAGYVKFS